MAWKIINDRLVETFEMVTFTEITEKLNSLAVVANAHNHHPDFSVFGYNKIRFELWTHYADCVTEADYKLADIIDQLFG